MTDFCIICLTELGCADPTGWLVPVKENGLVDPAGDIVCPWCYEDLFFLKDLVLDVPMMATAEEFVTIFNTKFGGNVNGKTDRKN